MEVLYIYQIFSMKINIVGNCILKFCLNATFLDEEGGIFLQTIHIKTPLGYNYIG